MNDINSNNSTDPQLQEFIKYFDRMEREASKEDYRNMLRDIRDTCEIRLKQMDDDTSDDARVDVP